MQEGTKWVAEKENFHYQVKKAFFHYDEQCKGSVGPPRPDDKVSPSTGPLPTDNPIDQMTTQSPPTLPQPTGPEPPPTEDPNPHEKGSDKGKKKFPWLIAAIIAGVIALVVAALLLLLLLSRRRKKEEPKSAKLEVVKSTMSTQSGRSGGSTLTSNPSALGASPSKASVRSKISTASGHSRVSSTGSNLGAVPSRKSSSQGSLGSAPGSGSGSRPRTSAIASRTSSPVMV